MSYVIKEARKREREPVIQGSTFHAYLVEFEGGQKAEMLQKPDTPAPKPGDTLEGEIVPGKEKDDGTKWPDKFKKAQSKTGWQPRSPQETAQIVRQHSQEMAIRYAIYLGGPTVALEQIKGWADWFDADARSVGQSDSSEKTNETTTRSVVPDIPEDRALKILHAAQAAALAEGTTLSSTLVAKLIDVGCETGKIGHLNVDQAEEIEAWIESEA